MDQVQRFIGYTRVSTEGQRSSGLGLEAQQAMIRRHLEATGGVLVAEYQEAESGKRDDRPEFLKAMQACRETGATLILPTLDRMGRKVHFISGVMQSGIPLVVADSPNDGTFILHVKAAMAEEEGRKISERTRLALAARRDRGLPMGAAAIRSGWTEARARVVRANGRKTGAMMREKTRAFVQGVESPLRELKGQELSLGDIARRMNELGYRTPQGMLWSRKQVQRCLKVLGLETANTRIPKVEKRILFLHDALRKAPSEIARKLNDEGVRSAYGSSWNARQVRRLLAREGRTPHPRSEYRRPVLSPAAIAAARQSTEELARKTS